MDVMAESSRYILNTYTRYPLVFDKGEGVWLYTVEGEKYLDMASGIAVSCLGHNHPALVRSIGRQAEKLLHVSNLYHTVPNTLLAKSLVERSVLDRAFFCNSGAEANEAAIKLARKQGKLKGGSNKHKIITLKESFHGRTLATITATGQPKYRKDFTPLPEGFDYTSLNSAEELAALMDGDTAAVLIELIQGESGIHAASRHYVARLRELCDKHDALLMVDEVQTGVGRTGRLFCYEHYLPVKPDVVTLAKGIAGGLPMGVLLVSEKLADVFQPGDHASTFGGNPVCSAAAAVVLDALDEDFLARVRANGDYFLNKLHRLKEKQRSIIDVRGKGLLLGIELDFPARELVDALIKRRIITVPAGERVVRFIPPLIITRQEVDLLMEALTAVFNKRQRD